MKKLTAILTCAAALLLSSCLDDTHRIYNTFTEQAQMEDSNIIKGWIPPGTRNIHQTVIKEWQSVDAYIRYDAPASENLREDILSLFRIPKEKERYNFTEEKSHRVNAHTELWMSTAVNHTQQGCSELDFWVFEPDSEGEEIELSRPNSFTAIRIFIDETHKKVYMHLHI